MLRIGLISDTHGLLRPQALAFLRGCDRILHAGDLCDEDVLAELGSIAPVTAVRGNNDRGPWASALRESERIDIDGIAIHVVHDLARLDIDPVAAGVRVVLYGHSHQPRAEERNGVLYVNPGSAGPRRFRLPVSVGELIVDAGQPAVRLVELPV